VGRHHNRREKGTFEFFGHTRCWGLGRLRQLFDLYIGIPSLEHGAQFAIESLDACLQQQMRSISSIIRGVVRTYPRRPQG